MDRVHAQLPHLAVGSRVDLADQAVAVQDRQRVVAPATLGGRLVHLEVVLELEQLLGAPAVVDQAVVRRQQRRPSGERPAEQIDRVLDFKTPTVQDVSVDHACPDAPMSEQL